MAKHKVSERDLLIEQCLYDTYCEENTLIKEGFFGNVMDGIRYARQKVKIQKAAKKLLKPLQEYANVGGTFGRGTTDISKAVSAIEAISQGNFNIQTNLNNYQEPDDNDY